MGKIILFYKYIDVDCPGRELKRQRMWCENLNLKGRIIIATEGINGTLGGKEENVDAYIALMREHELFADIDFKESFGQNDHFPRLRIVVKKEIVNLGIDPQELPASKGGKHLEPQDAHNLIAQNPDDLIILDCRNSFESKVGSFENAIKPEVTHFRDFPAYVEQHADLFKDKQVLMYCTGGVRCERGSAIMKTKTQAKEVFQLRGGIHKYVENYPDGYFRGKNYVFDGRIAMKVTDDILGNCALCQIPYDEYTNCLYATCNKQFICCLNCLEIYKNTCGKECYNLVYIHHAQKRPMPNKITSNSCSI